MSIDSFENVLVPAPLLEDLIKIRASFRPDLVSVPSLGDTHQDHHVIAEEALCAFQSTTLLAFELLWNNLNFNSCAFVHPRGG